MIIADLFETRVEEKIDPVIKVAERGDDHKLASEIGSYVVTPMIEKYLDDFLEQYTDTFLIRTTEVGIWISGYFGSGKSHLAKIMALLVENRNIEGITACERFESRLPPDGFRTPSILRSLRRMNQCDTSILAFNLNTISSSRTRELPEFLLSRHYLSRGYCNNLIYARVIEAELDRQGKIDDLHRATERLSGKKWVDIRDNPSFFRKYLFAAASEVAPEIFPMPEDVEEALREAEAGTLINVSSLVDTILEDLKRLEAERGKPQRFMWVMDETGQWIENNKGRLAQLQAFVEEAALKGQGKIWVAVTTHRDMGAIYKDARALDSDMKTMEARFRFKPALTTENIEQVLENRLLRKRTEGRQVLEALYEKCGSGNLKGIGELSNTLQILPDCSEDAFVMYYPFLPYQVHLIPDIVKSLRSRGGHGEQMSGSTRTLLAITQDVLRAGRIRYLDMNPGVLVRFDEIYHNLSGEGEVSPDVRTDVSRISQVVPDATEFTTSVAEVLFLIRELEYIPRTIDNLARLTIRHVDEDLSDAIARIKPELEKLMKAGLVARIGEEYEFLTGERRTFEDEVATVEAQMGQREREEQFGRSFISDSNWRKWLGSNVVSFKNQEFQFSLEVDYRKVNGTSGTVTLKMFTPFGRTGGVDVHDLQSNSLHSEEQNTIFFLSGRVPEFEQDLTRYIAMKDVIDRWKQDPYKSEDARKLAQERDRIDLPKLHRKVIDGLKGGIRSGTVIFRGATRELDLHINQNAGDGLLSVMAGFWPRIYTNFDRVPVRISNDQRAIRDVLAGKASGSADVKALALYDRIGSLNLQSPLIDAIGMYLSNEQTRGRRAFGKEMLEYFEAPPFGWDPNAVRVGVAAMVRAGSVKVILNKKVYTNPDDPDLVNAIRVSSQFKRTELELEETIIPPDTLTEVRLVLINLAKTRRIEETPAALAEAAGTLGDQLLEMVGRVELWASGSGMPLSPVFIEGKEVWTVLSAMTNPVHRVREIEQNRETLESGHAAICEYDTFVEQNSDAFISLRALKGQLEAIAYHTDSNSSIRELIAAWNVATRDASFVNQETWRRLLATQKKAELEVKELVTGWKESARKILEEDLAALPAKLMERHLDTGFVEKWETPLNQMLSEIDSVAIPAQVANLPSRAQAVVADLQRKIDAEVARIEREKVAGEAGVRERQKVRLSLKSLISGRCVGSIAEWEKLRADIDSRVRAKINDGFDVEFE